MFIGIHMCIHSQTHAHVFTHVCLRPDCTHSVSPVLGQSISTVARVAHAGEAAGGGIGAGSLRVAGTRYITLIDV